MPGSPLLEPLEHRVQYAAATAGGVDPDYLLDAAKAGAVIGQTPLVAQALPGSGGRTYLLAVRDAKKGINFGDGHYGGTGLLTIIAVNDGGDLDKKFGTNGVALTGRRVNYLSDTPGLLKLDGNGRLYFADDTRLLRFKANGKPDVAFGTRGAAAFATDDKPVQLCDFTPTDDNGVLVATTSTTDGVQRFAVQKIESKATRRAPNRPTKTVRTVWQTTYASGGEDVSGRSNGLAVGQAQFATGGGRTVLARIQTQGRLVTYPGTVGDPGGTVYVPSRQDAVLTRFDAAGNSADIAKKQIHLHDNQPAAIGTGDLRYPNAGNTLLYRQGRSLLMLTSEELVKFDLDTGRGSWIDLPGTFAYDNVAIDPKYQLFPDGTVGVQWVTRADKKGRETHRIDRYFADGTPAGAPGNALAAMIYPGDFATDNTFVVNQIFLSGTGRVQFLSSGTNGGDPSSLTLGRV